MAIGSGWQAIVAYVNIVTYYFIGLPIGCVLGFKTSLGVAVSLISIFVTCKLFAIDEDSNKLTGCILGFLFPGYLVGDDYGCFLANINSNCSHSQNKLGCSGN